MDDLEIKIRSERKREKKKEFVFLQKQDDFPTPTGI